MESLKKNGKWIYALLLVVLILPLFWWWRNGLLYTGKILLIQITALVGSYFMFRELYQNHLAVLLGVTLYVTSPWRFDMCYVQNRLLLSGVWSLVPLYLFFLVRLKRTESRRKKWLQSVLPAVVILAAIGYGSHVMFCLMAGFTLLAMLVLRRTEALWVLAGGVILWFPGNVNFLRYLFAQSPIDLGVPIQNIVPNGYVVLDYFTSFVYQAGRPGLGLGLLLLLGVISYRYMVYGNVNMTRESKAFGVAGGLCLFAATRYFPWELVQRLGEWALKFISLMETPALFAGFAVLFLPVAAVATVDESEWEKKRIAAAVVDGSERKAQEMRAAMSVKEVSEGEKERLAAIGSLAICWIAAIGIAVYQCYVLVGA